MEYTITRSQQSKLHNQLVCKITGQSLAREAGYTVHPIFILDNKTFISKFAAHLQSPFNKDLSKVYAISAMQRMELLRSPYQPVTCYIGNVSNLKALLRLFRFFCKQSPQTQHKLIHGVSKPAKVGHHLALASVLPSIVLAFQTNIPHTSIRDSDTLLLADASSSIDNIQQSRELVVNAAQSYMHKSAKQRKRTDKSTQSMPSSETLASLDLSLQQFSTLVALYKMPTSLISGNYRLSQIEELYQAVKHSDITSEQEMNVLVIELFLKNILETYVQDTMQYADFGIALRVEKSQETIRSKASSAITIESVNIQGINAIQSLQPSSQTTATHYTPQESLQEKLARLRSKHSIE